MTEQVIQKSIIKYLKTKAYVVKIVSASKSGIPDLLVLYRGMLIAVEIKTPDKRNNVSDLQKYNLDEITRHGGHAYVACSLNEVKEIIEGIKWKLVKNAKKLMKM